MVVPLEKGHRPESPGWPPCKSLSSLVQWVVLVHSPCMVLEDEETDHRPVQGAKTCKTHPAREHAELHGRSAKA